jgi:hypothetical protein
MFSYYNYFRQELGYKMMTLGNDVYFLFLVW